MSTTIGRSALADVNIVLARGADNSYAFRYSTTEDDVTTPVDLTDWTAASQVRRHPDGTYLLLDLSNYISLGGVTGTINIDVPASATEGLLCVDAVWDLELTSPAGAVIRFVEGRVRISRDVTR